MSGAGGRERRQQEAPATRVIGSALEQHRPRAHQRPQRPVRAPLAEALLTGSENLSDDIRRSSVNYLSEPGKRQSEDVPVQFTALIEIADGIPEVARRLDERRLRRPGCRGKRQLALTYETRPAIGQASAKIGDIS
jgi:hypothetical protein